MFDRDYAEKFINQNKDDMLKFLKDMIGLKSPSLAEKEVAGRVFEEMERLGAKNVHYDKAGNVLGEFGQGARCILLSSHMDAAGVADADKWTHEPYSGDIADGKIWGRGAGDNKGALAAMLYGAKLWSLMEPDAGYRVIVGGTVLEEDADGCGMKILLDELAVKPEFVMVGKPTGGAIHRGHRGRMEVRIDIKGESCHASTPEKGENALYIAADVLLALKELAGRLKSDPFLGKASLAATMLDVSPNKFNTVPGEVVICVDRRLTAGENYESALQEIREALPFPGVTVGCFLYKNKAWTGFDVEVEKYFPSWVIPEDHPAVKAAVRAGKLAFDKELPVDKWTVSTDGVGSMGYHSIPTVGYGPGERRVTDDYQKIDDLLDAVKYYAAFSASAGKQ